MKVEDLVVGKEYIYPSKNDWYKIKYASSEIEHQNDGNDLRMLLDEIFKKQVTNKTYEEKVIEYENRRALLPTKEVLMYTFTKDEAFALAADKISVERFLKEV